MIDVRYSNVAFNFHSILDRLRDAFCDRTRYSFQLLPFGVHRAIILVNSDSMKTTAARGTANGQPPFHSSLSYCGLDLSVSSKDVEIYFFNFGTDCASILQPNTTCCQIAVFKCVKNNHTCEQWQHQPIKQQITTILLCITQIIITSEHRILEGSAAEAAACKPGSAWDRKAQTTFLTLSQSSFHTNLITLSELLKQLLFCRYFFFHLAFCSFPATISSQATSTVTTTATTTATNTATTTTKAAATTATTIATTSYSHNHSDARVEQGQSKSKARAEQGKSKGSASAEQGHRNGRARAKQGQRKKEQAQSKGRARAENG